MDVRDDDDLDAFRHQVRAWLEANAPDALGNKHGQASTIAADAARLQWRQAFVERGWSVPTWPREYSGAGLRAAHSAIISAELRRLELEHPFATVLDTMSIFMLGATLLKYGTEEQKTRHLPGIARGTVRWCQGFSEPGAGSDLASLQAWAEDAGDHWIVNGTKTWTTGADQADWCFGLVRTDKTKKQEGISFVLFAMDQPGVEVKPIRLISGDSEFCETFLTDVRVEKRDLIGPLNGGWTVAKSLLQHERNAIMGEGPASKAAPALSDIAKAWLGLDDEGRLKEREGLRDRIAKHEMKVQAFTLTAARAKADMEALASGSASILKNAGTWIRQERAELELEIRGLAGLFWTDESSDDPDIVAVRDWLNSKASTIYGGSQEIQNNIISKHVLRLP